MAFFNISRLINRHKRLLFLTTSGAIFVFCFANIFSVFLPYNSDYDPSSSALLDRLRREASQPDPVNEKDYLTDDLFSEAVMGRFSRRILNESLSFYQENGSKRPIPIKQLNKEYTEAKKMYFAKKNCKPRPPPTTAKPGGGGGSTTPGGGGGATTPGAGGTPAPPAGETPAPPAETPAPARRRRRGAVQATTERIYYCDEFTTTPPPTTTGAPKETTTAGGGGGASTTVATTVATTPAA